MRESRTYGSVRGGHRKVLVYSIDGEIILMKYDVSIDKELFGVYSEIRLGILRFHADVKAPDNHFWDYMNTEVLPQVRTKTYKPGTIHSGDLMLYGSDCLVLFYQTFQSGYSYTKIGKILKPQGLEKALGEGEIKITISHFRG